MDDTRIGAFAANIFPCKVSVNLGRTPLYELGRGKPYLRNEEFVEKLLMIDEKTLKWDKRFLELAKFISTWSRDPSTQTGAVIVDNKNRIVSVGFNGFARGVSDKQEDYDNRELKYSKIIHCEINAILFANKDLDYCCLYTWPFMSCDRCCTVVIQSGIKRVVAPKLEGTLLERWGKSVELSKQMFQEAGIQVVEVPKSGDVGVL